MPEIDLTTQVNWQEAIPSVLRALKQIGEATPAMEDAVCSELRLGFGRTHPAYDILGNLALLRAALHLVFARPRCAGDSSN
ncbi:MAG: hypothetical protein R2873_19560 [Caldilineaceae bacterium]